MNLLAVPVRQPKLAAQARILAQLAAHIRETKKIYENECRTFAQNLLTSANLMTSLKAVEVLEMEDGFLVRFRFRE